jgi:hypothetical protein
MKMNCDPGSLRPCAFSLLVCFDTVVHSSNLLAPYQPCSPLDKVPIVHNSYLNRTFDILENAVATVIFSVPSLS